MAEHCPSSLIRVALRTVAASCHVARTVQRDLERVRQTDILLYHGFEVFLNRLLNKTAPDFSAVRIAVTGNWLVPEIQRAAALAVAEALGQRRPALAAEFRQNAQAYATEIRLAAEHLEPLRQRFRGIPTVSAFMNRPYVEWLGFDVVATLQRNPDLSVRRLSQLVTAARRAQARAVLANRQSGSDVGRTVARELDIPLVVLSNFPNPADPRPYAQVLERNAARLEAVFP